MVIAHREVTSAQAAAPQARSKSTYLPCRLGLSGRGKARTAPDRKPPEPEWSRVEAAALRPDDVRMEVETFVEGSYPAEPYAEVIPGLSQASAALSPAEMLAMFDVLIDVGGRDRWEGAPDPRYSFHPLDDAPYIADAEMIHTVGERIASLVREGKHVAVNCLSGVNRSGLLVGRALVALGYTPETAVDAVRAARGPMALSNKHFVRFLLVDCTPRALARRRQLSLPI